MQTLLWFKLYLIAVVLTTVYFSSPPYFPIEISRCAASGAHHIFSMGLFESFLVYAATLKQGVPLSPLVILIWAALSIIGFFNDVDHWLIHMIGVTILVVAVALKIKEEKRSFGVFWFAFAVYFSRFIFKAQALLFLEHADDPLQHNFDIMFGHAAPLHPRTLLAFQFAGFFQWIFLAMLLYTM